MKEALKTTFGWELNDAEFDNALEAVRQKYEAETFSFQVVQVGGGYEFATKKEHAPLINTFLNQKAKKRLTRAALETLSIIAYKQPITRVEIEQIRGVNCDYTIQKLLEKELIVISGRAEGPGHPLTYSTSEQFMEYFGINSPADLPKLREIETAHDNEIGEAPPIETHEQPLQETEEQPEQEAAEGPEVEIVNPFDPRLQEETSLKTNAEAEQEVISNQ
jgi:segregation and condensation protein B